MYYYVEKQERRHCSSKEQLYILDNVLISVLIRSYMNTSVHESTPTRRFA